MRMKAREELFYDKNIGDNMQYLSPIILPGKSDSAEEGLSLDGAVDHDCGDPVPGGVYHECGAYGEDPPPGGGLRLATVTTEDAAATGAKMRATEVEEKLETRAVHAADSRLCAAVS